MPSLWPFRRNKKKKLALLEEKQQEKDYASNVQTSDNTKEGRYINANREAQPREPSRSSRPRHEDSKPFSYDANEQSIQQNLSSQRSITHARTEPLSQEPLTDTHNSASARNNTLELNQLGSLTSLQPEHNFTAQALYEIPTLRSKRSSTTSDILRSKSGRSKYSTKEREKEIKALSSPGSIPIPRRPASFSSGPLARDSKKFAGGLDRRLQRPTSEVSLPMAESLRTSFSGESAGGQHSFRVSPFDALSPRPTIRYGERPSLPSVRERASRSASRKDKGPVVPEESTMPSNPRARVKEMADHMDAKTLRELMERDQRRRDRKKALDAEKLQRKLQKKLDKQKADEATAREANAPVELEGTPVPTNINIDSEQYIPGTDNQQLDAARPTRRRDTETSDRRTREMSRDDSPSIDPFADPQSGSRGDPRLSSEQTSIRDDAIIESATAVRLSTISMSPPASPMLSREKTMSPSNLSNVATLPRDSPEPSSSIATSGYLQPETRREIETSGKSGSSWTSIFKRGGTKRKVSSDKEKEQPTMSEFSNVSRESFLRKNQPTSVPVVQRSFKRDTTPHRKQSKFREDLPELPVSPPRSRVQSPDLERPLSPYVDDTRKLDDLNNSNTMPTPIEDVHPALRGQLSNSRQQSSHGQSPEPTHLSQSLASIDSEASWLSGRPQKRSSIPIESVRASLASLNQPLEESEDRFDEPDFSRQDYSNNTIRGPGGLSSQFRGIQANSSGGEISSHQSPQFPYDESVKYDTVKGRRPNIIQRGPMARSREGLLDEYIANEEESPVSPMSPGGDQDSPTGVDSSIHRATSVKLGSQSGHARQLSAGSARLLDILPRSPSDGRRASVISAASTTRSPLASPRESAIYSPKPQ